MAICDYKIVLLLPILYYLQKKLSKVFDGAPTKRKSARKQNYETECLLLDSSENLKASGVGSFLKQEFGRRLIKVNNLLL